MQAIKQLNNKQAEIKVITDQIQAIHQRVETANKVADKFHGAAQEIVAAKQKRRSLLAMLHMGKAKKADIDPADASILEAQNKAASLEDEGIGASAAAELLQSEIDSLNTQAHDLRRDLPVLQYRAAVEATASLVAEYVQAADQAEAAFAALAGALMAADEFASPLAGLPHVFNHAPMEIAFSNATSLVLMPPEWKPFRPHARVFGKAVQQKQQFAEHLRSLGII